MIFSLHRFLFFCLEYYRIVKTYFVCFLSIINKKKYFKTKKKKCLFKEVGEWHLFVCLFVLASPVHFRNVDHCYRFFYVLQVKMFKRINMHIQQQTSCIYCKCQGRSGIDLYINCSTSAACYIDQGFTCKSVVSIYLLLTWNFSRKNHQKVSCKFTNYTTLLN